MPTIKMQKPVFVNDQDLEQLFKKSNALNETKVTVQGQPDEPVASIPIITSSGDQFQLDAKTQRNVKVELLDLDRIIPNLRRMQFFVDHEYSYSLLSRGIDYIHVYQVDSNNDGINDVLVRYSKDGHFYKGGHLLVMQMK